MKVARPCDSFDVVEALEARGDNICLKAWRAEAALAMQYSFRMEILQSNGVAGKLIGVSLRQSSRKIASLRRQAAYWEAKAKAGREGI